MIVKVMCLILDNEKWQTIKPSPHYKNSKVQTNRFEDMFDELKVNKNENGWVNARLTVEDDDGTVYSGYFNAYTDSDMNILAFGHLNGQTVLPW